MRSVRANHTHRGHGHVGGREAGVIQGVGEKHLEIRRRERTLGRGRHNDLAAIGVLAILLTRADVRHNKAKVREGVVRCHEPLGEHVYVECGCDPRT